MIRSKFIKKFEDFYETTYFIIRIFLKNMVNFFISYKYLKITFLNFRIFCFLKNSINRLKKTFDLSKNVLDKKISISIQIDNYKKKINNATDLSCLNEVEFLSKSFNMILKFTERSKTNPTKKETNWLFQKVSNDIRSVDKFSSFIPLNKGNLLFISTCSKKKIISFNILNKYVFF